MFYARCFKQQSDGINSPAADPFIVLGDQQYCTEEFNKNEERAPTEHERNVPSTDQPDIFHIPAFRDEDPAAVVRDRPAAGSSRVVICRTWKQRQQRVHPTKPGRSTAVGVQASGQEMLLPGLPSATRQGNPDRPEAGLREKRISNSVAALHSPRQAWRKASKTHAASRIRSAHFGVVSWTSSMTQSLGKRAEASPTQTEVALARFRTSCADMCDAARKVSSLATDARRELRGACGRAIGVSAPRQVVTIYSVITIKDHTPN